MPCITPTEVTQYASISLTAGSITQGMIQAVQDNINLITGNYFISDISVQTFMSFDASAGTITCGTDWGLFGFAAGDEVYIYGSYRNDGYKLVSSISTTIMTVSTTTNVVAELSGANIIMSLVQWPTGLKQVAAQMIAFDVDARDKVAANVTSHSLGPFSESFGGSSQSRDTDEYGYPNKITNKLNPWRMARLR